MKKTVLGFCLMCFYSLSLPVQADGLRLYMVVQPDESSGKSIKLYRDPTKHSKVIKRIPLRSTWLIEKSRPKIYSNVRWQEMSWRGKRGWVMCKYIKYDSVSSALANKKSCVEKKKDSKGCIASSS